MNDDDEPESDYDIELIYAVTALVKATATTALQSETRRLADRALAVAVRALEDYHAPAPAPVLVVH